MSEEAPSSVTKDAELSTWFPQQAQPVIERRDVPVTMARHIKLTSNCDAGLFRAALGFSGKSIIESRRLCDLHGIATHFQKLSYPDGFWPGRKPLSVFGKMNTNWRERCYGITRKCYKVKPPTEYYRSV